MKYSFDQRLLSATTALLVTLSSAGAAQRPVDLAPNAPRDRPTAADICQWKALLAATEPFVQKARASLPGAVERYRAGLPPRQSFFVTTRLTDSLGHFEQVFVAIDSLDASTFIGQIASEIDMVRGYRRGQRHVVRTEDVVDWMFSKPDGSEEGNEVGKFLDTYRPPAACRNATF